MCNFNSVLQFSDLAYNNQQQDNQTENLPARDPQTSSHADPQQRITHRIPYDEILPPSYFSITHEPPPGYTQVRKNRISSRKNDVLLWSKPKLFKSLSLLCFLICVVLNQKEKVSSTLYIFGRDTQRQIDMH